MERHDRCENTNQEFPSPSNSLERASLYLHAYARIFPFGVQSFSRQRGWRSVFNIQISGRVCRTQSTEGCEHCTQGIFMCAPPS